MPTTKKRINISVPDDIEAILKLLAERDEVPQATKASELLRSAIEIDEDEVFNELAEKRDTKNAKFIPHNKKIWS
jgi:hypothetical protein